MEITVDSFDRELKDILCDVITHRLVLLYKSIPMEESAVDTLLVTGNTKQILDEEVKKYFKSNTEQNITVTVSNEDYKKVYLHLI